MPEKKEIVVFLVLMALAIAATVGMNTCNAVRAGDDCESYRYSRQIDTPVSCIDYLKNHPKGP